MDENDDESHMLTRGEVPSALLNLVYRVQTVKEIVDIFSGWDSEVAHFKNASITSLSHGKRNLKEISLIVEILQTELYSLKENEDGAKYLKHHCNFILNNIPDRFHCPTIVSHPKSAATGKDVTIASAKQNAPNSHEQPSSSNIPEIFFLTVDEFEKVPKYLKGGRVTYDKINQFIELFNKVLSSKYVIFKKKKSTLKKRDADLWNEYYKQELKETKGLYFCVANDFKHFIGSNLDKASLNLLIILRHCGRIRELRTGGILRYVAVF